MTAIVPLLSLLLPQAQAVVYGGNPGVTIEVGRAENDLVSAEVLLTKVRVAYCGSGYTDYTVNETVDMVEGYTLTILGGNLCAIIPYWGEDLLMEGNGQYGAFSLLYENNTTPVTVQAGGTMTAPLVPFTWESGVVYGGNPEVKITIQ